MKKFRSAKQFLEELSKTPVVSAVCSKLNLSRQTIYRWIKEDSEFAENYKECLKQGSENINDLAESKLIAAINHGDSWAIKYWLDNNKKNYMKPREKIKLFINDEKIAPILVRFIDSLDRDNDKK